MFRYDMSGALPSTPPLGSAFHPIAVLQADSAAVRVLAVYNYGSAVFFNSDPQVRFLPLATHAWCVTSAGM